MTKDLWLNIIKIIKKDYQKKPVKDIKVFLKKKKKQQYCCERYKKFTRKRKSG